MAGKEPFECDEPMVGPVFGGQPLSGPRDVVRAAMTKDEVRADNLAGMMGDKEMSVVNITRPRRGYGY